MRTSKAELPAQRLDDYEGRTHDFGEWRVAFESMPAQFPPSPFEGLPDDRCQCPHLGVLLKGSFRVTYLDRSSSSIRATSHDRSMATIMRNLGVMA